MNNHLVTFTLSSLLVAAAGAASAQPRDSITSDSRTTSDSLEISLGGGYVQGGGTMGSPDLGTPGGGAEIAVGGRILGRHLTLSAYTTLDAVSDRGDVDDIASASLGAKADWHFVPQASVDPWVSLGVGAKIQWSGGRDVLGGTRLGCELAKAQAGVDFQLTDSFSVGPTIGASATLYTHEDTDMTDGYETIDDKRVDLMTRHVAARANGVRVRRRVVGGRSLRRPWYLRRDQRSVIASELGADPSARPER